MRWVAPSPSEAIRRVISMQMYSISSAKAALSSSVLISTPEAPFASKKMESLVEVSPSTVHILKLLSTAAVSIFCRSADSALASVVT
ncbi:hypothetical protein DSECCO2_378270 [anaerobic digester metagenome]